MCGVSAVSGSWKIMVIFEPRMRFSVARLQAQQLLAARTGPSRVARPLRGQQAHDGHEGLALARAALADDAQALALATASETPRTASTTPS